MSRTPSAESAPSEELSPLERFLCLFTDVRPGEGTTGLVMFANVFLILCAYYFIKPLRDGWIAVSAIEGLSKMEVKAYSSFGQAILFLFAVTAYARLADRVPRVTLITRATLFCISNLLIFWLLQPGFLLENLPGSGIAFYLWAGMFGLFVVSQFWAFAADLYPDEQGKRLVPMIAIGATSGAVAGSYLTDLIVQSAQMDSGTLLLAANVPLLLSIALTHIADRRGPSGEARGTPPDGETEETPPASPESAISMVLGHPYLIAIGLVALLTNWVNTNGENLMFQVLQEWMDVRVADAGLTDPTAVTQFVRDETTAFYGRFFFWVNTAALILQAFFASRLLQLGGFGFIFMLLPIISLVSYSLMVMFPVLAVVRWMKMAENSADYSIANTSRHVLWLPASSEMKFKAKPAIETLFVRSGDGLAALTVLVGVQGLDLTTQSFFVFNAGLALACVLAALVVVRRRSQGMASELGRATT